MHGLPAEYERMIKVTLGMDIPFTRAKVMVSQETYQMMLEVMGDRAQEANLVQVESFYDFWRAQIYSFKREYPDLKVEFDFQGY